MTFIFNYQNRPNAARQSKTTNIGFKKNDHIIIQLIITSDLPKVVGLVNAIRVSCWKSRAAYDKLSPWGPIRDDRGTAWDDHQIMNDDLFITRREQTLCCDVEVPRNSAHYWSYKCDSSISQKANYNSDPGQCWHLFGW